MTKKKYRRYSPEFKRHALKRASEDGMTDKGVCEELGTSISREQIILSATRTRVTRPETRGRPSSTPIILQTFHIC